jgi:hypothetical protein
MSKRPPIVAPVAPLALVQALEALHIKDEKEEDPMYEETALEIQQVCAAIPLSSSDGDGRLASALKEIPFLEELQRRLLEAHPAWVIQISPPRAACDIMIQGLRINLKLTTGGTDNAMNKPSVFYSLTGRTDYPYSSTANDFLLEVQKAKAAGQIKIMRNRSTEYHYLVKNKTTGAVLFKPIFDIHRYISNPSNDLQINWKSEFEHAAEVTAEADYKKKVHSLLEAYQTSVRKRVESEMKFAYADLGALLE